MRDLRTFDNQDWESFAGAEDPGHPHAGPMLGTLHVVTKTETISGLVVNDATEICSLVIDKDGIQIHSHELDPNDCWTLHLACTFVLGHHLARSFNDGIPFDYLKDLGFELI